MAAAFFGQVRFLYPCHSLPQCLISGLCISISRSWEHINKAKLSGEEIDALANVLEVPASNLHDGLGAHWWPNRGLGTTPPTDPVIYRLYEVHHHSSCKLVHILILLYKNKGVLVYGYPIKVSASLMAYAGC